MFSDGDFLKFCLGLVAVGGAFTAACVFGLPWLWALCKPLLHALTA
jgi:hypothetical protein